MVLRKFSHRAPGSFYDIRIEDIKLNHYAEFYQDIIRFVTTRGR